MCYLLPVIPMLFSSTHAHQRSTVLSVRRGLDWVLASALDGVPWQVTDDVQKFYLTVNRCSPMRTVYPPAMPFCNFLLCLKVRLGDLLRRLDDALSAFRSVKTRASERGERTRLSSHRMLSDQRSPPSQHTYPRKAWKDCEGDELVELVEYMRVSQTLISTIKVMAFTSPCP